MKSLKRDVRESGLEVGKVSSGKGLNSQSSPRPDRSCSCLKDDALQRRLNAQKVEVYRFTLHLAPRSRKTPVPLVQSGKTQSVCRNETAADGEVFHGLMLFLINGMEIRGHFPWIISEQRN